jgi:hypothetical protein
MAKPIKETPILTGECAKKFLDTITKNEVDKTNRVSKEEHKESKELYEKMVAKASF